MVGLTCFEHSPSGSNTITGRTVQSGRLATRLETPRAAVRRLRPQHRHTRNHAGSARRHYATGIRQRGAPHNQSLACPLQKRCPLLAIATSIETRPSCLPIARLHRGRLFGMKERFASSNVPGARATAVWPPASRLRGIVSSHRRTHRHCAPTRCVGIQSDSLFDVSRAKTGRAAKATLSKRVEQVLLAYLASLSVELVGPIFPNRSGRPYSKDTLGMTSRRCGSSSSARKRHVNSPTSAGPALSRR
jgi:hypothetical protein